MVHGHSGAITEAFVWEIKRFAICLLEHWGISPCFWLHLSDSEKQSNTHNSQRHDRQELVILIMFLRGMIYQLV